MPQSTTNFNSQSQENVPDKNTSCGPRRTSSPPSGTAPRAGFHEFSPSTSPAHVHIGPKHSVPGQRLLRSLQQLSITSLGGCLRQMVRRTSLASPTQNPRHKHSTTPSHCGNYPLRVRRVSDKSLISMASAHTPSATCAVSVKKASQRELWATSVLHRRPAQVTYILAAKLE